MLTIDQGVLERVGRRLRDEEDIVVVVHDVHGMYRAPVICKI